MPVSDHDAGSPLADDVAIVAAPTLEPRVTYVGPVPPFCSGVAQHSAWLTETLGRRADVTVLSWQHQYPRLLFRRTQHDPTVDPHPGARFTLRWWDPLSWWRVGRQAARGDVLVLAWTTPFHALAYRVIMAAARGTRKVAVVHNAVPHEKLPLQRPLTRGVLSRCDGAVVHAERIANELAQFAPNLETVTTPMPPLIEVAATPLPEGDQVRLLFFGFVRDYKGLDVALDGLVLLSQRDVKPHLTIMGEFWGPIEAWRVRVTRLGLDRQVELRPGYASQHDLRAQLAAHHAVLLPYRSASQSGVAPVALASGRPVVATATGGLDEVVHEGVNGTLARPSDAASLADAIERCIRLLPNLASRAAKSTASWDDVANAVLKFAR